MELCAQFAGDLPILCTSMCNDMPLISHLSGLRALPQVLRLRGMCSSSFVSSRSEGSERKTLVYVPLTLIFKGWRQELRKQFSDDPQSGTKPISCCPRDFISMVPREEKTMKYFCNYLGHQGSCIHTEDHCSAAAA